MPFAEYAFAVDEIAAIAAVRSGMPPAAEDSVAGTPVLPSDAWGEATLRYLIVSDISGGENPTTAS